MNDSGGPAWLVRAQEVRQLLSQARFGQKGIILAERAKATGYAVSTLKREMAAADFVERMDKEDPALGSALRELGGNAVTEISRLFVDDPKLARATATAAAAGSIPEADIRRARQATAVGSPSRTGRQKSLEFLQFLTEKGRRYGIFDTRRPRILGALMEFQMHDNLRGGICTGCAVFDGSISENIERVDRHLAMLFFYDRLVVGFDAQHVPPIWERRMRQMRGGRQDVLLFTRGAEGFAEARV